MESKYNKLIKTVVSVVEHENNYFVHVFPLIHEEVSYRGTFPYENATMNVVYCETVCGLEDVMDVIMTIKLGEDGFADGERSEHYDSVRDSDLVSKLDTKLKENRLVRSSN